MKHSAFIAAVALAVIAAGCETKSRARLEAREAFVAGQQQAMARAQQGQSVMFVGDVQNAVVPWTEELSLASAILQAEFRGRRDPRAFTLHRNGLAYTVTSKQLLNGEDIALQPGDQIEIVP